MGCAASKSDPWALCQTGAVGPLVHWLDSPGSNVDAVDPVKGRGSLLHAAAAADRAECIKLLLKRGANVDLAVEGLGTALHAAAAAGASTAVALLLDNGASHTAYRGGLTAAEIAELRGYSSTARYIRLITEAPAAAPPRTAADIKPTVASGGTPPADQGSVPDHGQPGGAVTKQGPRLEPSGGSAPARLEPFSGGITSSWEPWKRPHSAPGLLPKGCAGKDTPQQLAPVVAVPTPTQLREEQHAVLADPVQSQPGQQEPGAATEDQHAAAAVPDSGGSGGSALGGQPPSLPLSQEGSGEKDCPGDSVARWSAGQLANPPGRYGGGASSSSSSGGNSNPNSALSDPLLEIVRQAMLSQPPPCGGDAAASGGAEPPNGAAGTPPQTKQEQQGRSGCERPSASASSAAADRMAGCLTVALRPIKFDELQIINTDILGSGSYGRVYAAKLYETRVAVKVLLDLEEAQKAEPGAVWTLSNPILFNLQKESSLMASLMHDNIVRFRGVCICPPAVITEYCARGSLDKVLEGAKTDPAKLQHLTWTRRLAMALDAATGMLYLHKCGIVHRDLKSPNLLVDRYWAVKVADFNLSKILDTDTGSGRSALANMNPRWLAPEILNGEAATCASDVFSWGVVMWEILTLEMPWPKLRTWSLVGKLMDGVRLEVPPRDQLPGFDTPAFQGLDTYVALMKRCWAQRPEERPDFGEVVVQIRSMLDAHRATLAGTQATAGGAGAGAGGRTPLVTAASGVLAPPSPLAGDSARVKATGS